MEQKQCNLLFCCCFGLWIDAPVGVPTVFREGLIQRGPGVTLQSDIHEIAVGGASDGMVTHQGDEMGYVLVGVLDLIVEGLLWRRRRATDFTSGRNGPTAGATRGTRRRAFCG
jgi:hypothetical protein